MNGTPSRTISQPNRIEPRRPHSGVRRWLGAVVLALVSMGLLQLAQHEFLMQLPMVWYHAVATVLNAIVVSVVVVLYRQWRASALQAEEALGRLRASEALREDMTHMLVHDLKTPLTASLVASQMLLQRGGVLGDAERELLSMAVRGQTRLTGMIEDLLDIARAEGEEMPLQLADNDLGPMIQAAVDEAALAAEEAEIKLAVDLEACPPVRSDAEKTRRVVANLLANAIKFTPRGGQVTVGLRSAAREALVTVRDNGEGIPEGLQERIFEKFAQAQAAAEGHRMSVGLGLSFCRLAVEAQGGRIWVESTVGKGSTFSFSLPLSA